MYTGGFLVFVLLMAILEQMGVGADTIGILFVAFTIVIYAGIGVLSRTMAVDAYYVAGRQVPAVFNGMATAADWMSGASFVAMAGGIYFGGHGYLAFVVGWTGLRWPWLPGVRGRLDRGLHPRRLADGALPA
jgi:cation/acetate symporter